MGAGGLQALAKSGLPLKGKRVVIAGSGPLLLAVARYMKLHDVDVRLIAEQAPQSALLRFGMRLASHPGKLAQAMSLRAGLLGVPYMTNCWPVSAQGSEKLESVTLRRANGSTWTVACDYLACGFGLIPNVELAALLGCRLSADSVEVDEFQQTSLPAVYSAGEATGIGGLELSLAEGEIAGYAAGGNMARARTQFHRRASHRQFANALEKTFALRPELRETSRSPNAGVPLRRCHPGARALLLQLARGEAAHALRHGAVPGPRLRRRGENFCWDGKRSPYGRRCCRRAWEVWRGRPRLYMMLSAADLFKPVR